MVINSDIRIRMLGSDNTDVLSDDFVSLNVEDAKSFTGITDETNIALHYYTMFLIADNWESIGAVESREGVRYRKPEPTKYLDLFNKALDGQVSSSDLVYAAKVSTNVGNIFDDQGVLVKGNYENQF